MLASGKFVEHAGECIDIGSVGGRVALVQFQCRIPRCPSRNVVTLKAGEAATFARQVFVVNICSYMVLLLSEVILSAPPLMVTCPQSPDSI